MREAIAGRLVGTKVARVEDPRLLTGTGRYVDDVTVPGMLHAALRAQPVRPRRSSAGSTSTRRVVIPAWSRSTRASTCEALTHPFMGLLPLPGLYHPRVLRARGRPRARRRRSGRARSSPSRVTSPRTRRSSWRSTTRSLRPIATIEHALDPSRPADLARRPRQRAAARPAPSTATSTPRSRPPTVSCASSSSSTATPTSRWRRAGAWPRSTRSRARCSTTRPRRTPTCLKWSLAALTGRRPVWRVAGRDRPSAGPPGRLGASGRRRWARRTRPRRIDPATKAAPLRNRSVRASAPISPGKAMAEPFLREPIRIVHLARMVLGLLARDPATLPRVHRPGRRRRVRRQGAPDPRRRRGARGRRRPRPFGEVDRGPQRAPVDRGTGARGDARRRGRGARRRHAARRCACT